MLELAGPLAQFEELTGSGFINERKVFTTIADLPGFALSIEYEHLKPGMRVVREFHLPGYHRVVSSSRTSVVLANVDSAMPDLLILPIEMPRSHHFDIVGEGLVNLIGFPRTKHRVRLGFFLLRDFGTDDYDAIRRVFTDVLNPLTLQLDEAGRGVVKPRIRRPYPRVVRIIYDRSTPFRVQEGGYWYHRGGQPARDKGVWLHLYHAGAEPLLIEAFDPVRSLAPRPGPGAMGSMVVEAEVDRPGADLSEAG